MSGNTTASTARQMGETLVRGMSTEQAIQTTLDFVRRHLRMDVAYLSEFIGDRMVLRAVSAPDCSAYFAAQNQLCWDSKAVRAIFDGSSQNFVTDIATAAGGAPPPSGDFPVHSYAVLPIRRRNGAEFGLFCCLSRRPAEHAVPCDFEVMRGFVDVAEAQLNRQTPFELVPSDVRTRITQMLESQNFDVVFQPIMDAEQSHPKGFEAFCRFHTTPYRPPNLWFEEARAVGLQQELELSVIKRALPALDRFPDDVYLSIKASPNTVATGDLEDILATWPTERVVLEVTEHGQLRNQKALEDALQRLRFTGVRLAIDNAGAAYSGLQFIVRLMPDIIKLDISLTDRIDQDIVHRSLGAALVTFAKEIGADIVAEGIERGEELVTLANLGVPLAQGYYLGHPADLETAQRWFTQPGSVSKG